MSTQVMYKGSEIASFSNDTKTLKTSGKYLEGDISITDTSSAAAVVVTEEPDINGGVIKNIMAVDISNDTVDAAHLLSGYTAHDGQGNAVTGSYVPPSPTLITKSITANGTYSAEDDSADGYSEVTVNVSGGGGGSSEDGDVIFIDYDGTVLHSYTAAEALALTELPANPLVSSYSERITPYQYDYEPGWVESSNGVWHYENSTNNHTDVYQVEKGKAYKLQLGSTVGNVFAATLIGINPVGDTSNVQGTLLIGKSSPSANDSISFIADKNGYLMVTKDYNNTTGLQSYLYERVVNDPKYTPLTVQGWNYTLAQIKTEVNSVGQCVVGQMYTPLDGKTRIYIHIPDNTPSAQMTFYVTYKQSVSRGVTVDWGDGSKTNDTNSYNTARSHTYANPGDYEITLTVTSGTISFGGSSSNAIYGGNINYNKQRIRKIYFGNSIQALGQYICKDCYNMKEVVIPPSVTSIDQYAFYQTYSLRSIIVPRNVSSLGNYCFADYSDGVSTRESISLPPNITSLPTNILYYNLALKRVSIPSSVVTIGASAFRECRSIKKITIPNGVTDILSSTFQNCTNLETIDIPSGVTSIGANAFSYCTNLETIDIPSGVTSIEGSAFYDCVNLETIDIPSSVTSIGNNTFATCYKLTDFVITNGVITIGNSALPPAIALAENHSITIPDSVTSIGTNVFNRTVRVEEFHFLSETPPALGGSNTINRGCLQKIYVPYSEDHSILADYKAASVFSGFADYIFEEEPT